MMNKLTLAGFLLIAFISLEIEAVPQSDCSSSLDCPTRFPLCACKNLLCQCTVGQYCKSNDNCKRPHFCTTHGLDPPTPGYCTDIIPKTSTEPTTISPMSAILKKTLRKYNLSDLYEPLHQHGITNEILWELTQTDMKEIGLSVGQRIRYLKVKPNQEKTLETTTHIGDKPCRIRTTGGTSVEGSLCMLPFEYKGKTYTNCTDTEHTELWCITDTENKWGNCKGTCD